MFALLRRGLLAGALAGLLAGLVAFAIGESALQQAINFEESGSAALVHDSGIYLADAGHDHGTAAAAAGGHDHGGEEEELVSRPWQRVGLLLATTLSGSVLGGLLSLVYGFRRRRRPDEDAWTAALWLGAAGALAWVVFPLILTPSNPPGIGDPSTITDRTLGYLGAVAGGLAVAWLVSRIVRALPADRPRWQPIAAGLATIVAGLALLWLVVPTPVAPPEGFPADVLWHFRMASLATTLTLWTVMTVSFAALVDRAERPATVRVPAAEPAAA